MAMTRQYHINPLQLNKKGPDYPGDLTVDEYDELRDAMEVVDALWFVEESYDNMLQNAVDFEIAVERQAANQRSNISSFPDEADLEIRLLNRLIGNFLSTAKACCTPQPFACSRHR
jgi:hypothetical protein